MTHEEILKQTKEALELAIQQKKANQDFMRSIGPAVIDALRPVLNHIKEAVSAIRVEVKPNIEINPKIDTPRIPAPEVTVNVPDFPKIPAPIVNVPAFPKIPDLQWPKEKMPIEGWVQLMGVSLERPLPVQIRDANGRPVDFAGSITQILGGGGGGKADFFTIKGYSQSAFADYLNADGRLRVSVETGGGWLTDSELRATPLQTQQVSGYADSVNVITTVGLTDTQLRASTLDVKQVSGAVHSVVVNDVLVSVPVFQVSGAKWSTEATQGTSPWVVSAADLDIRDLVNATDSISAYQVSGHKWSTEATQSGTWNITTVTGITNSVAASLIDSTGVQFSGSNPLPITIVSGALTSSIAVGDQLHDAADDGGAPVKVGGIARQTNQTAVADGDRVSSTYDDLGRQIVRHQVRDLTQSAYAQLTTGTETTLLAGVASTFLDLLWIVGANNSDVAVTVDIRSGTAGSTLLTLQIPANGTAGIAPVLPVKQEIVAGTWTADMGDITGTTVSLSALFSKEI